jgi:predicted permease
MKDQYLVVSVISFLMSLFMFFIIFIVRQIPIGINRLLENGEETNEIVFNVFTYFPPIVALILSILFYFLYKKNK